MELLIFFEKPHNNIFMLFFLESDLCVATNLSFSFYMRIVTSFNASLIA
nr:MAG TPA: hypothetical protein [Caudoviricetes sp.]DAU43800.1 MAG TPA: hypothetical protein [Caudoviricetes sp.]